MKNIRHEIESRNLDVDVRFYLSVDEGSYVPPHWHNSLEMVYVQEGSITMIFENHKVELLPGEFIIVNQRTIHSILSQKNKALVLQIPTSVINKYVPQVELLRFVVDMHATKASDKIKLESIKKIFQDMYIVYDVQPEGYLLKFKSLLYELLYTLIQSYSYKIVQKDMEKDKKNLDRLTKILHYLKDYHREHISISELAELIGYHPDYLSRFFKKYMGLTIIEYLYAIRINYIYQDLMDTNQSIHEIFENHGCNNYRVAMRLFKERYGCTPKEFRKQYKNTSSEE